MKSINSANPEKQIMLLSMIYTSLFFASITVGYKIVAFGHSLYCASIVYSGPIRTPIPATSEH
jgi:hypothetical protein